MSAIYIAPVKRIVTAVCEVAGVSPQVLCGRSRSKHVAQVRWCLWFILRNRHGFTLSNCGRVTGHDHSTVSHGLGMLRELEPLPALLAEVIAAGRDAVVEPQAPEPLHVLQARLEQLECKYSELLGLLAECAA